MSSRTPLFLLAVPALLAAAACINFDDKRAAYCANNPGFCDGGTVEPTDGGAPANDAGTGTTDAGTDGGAFDAGHADAGNDAGTGTPDAGPADAGAPDAGPPDAGPADAGPPDAGFCRAPPQLLDGGPITFDGGSPTWYFVNVTLGNDTIGAGTQASPWKTLDHALATVTSGEIHLCAGTYSGTFTLTKPVSVRGGYNCSSWTRTASFGFQGFDAGFDGMNTTIVTSLPNTCSPALIVDSSANAGIDRSVILDGLTLQASACTTSISNTPFTLELVHGASPTVVNCIIQGGSGTATGGAIGSGAIFVGSGAAPDLGYNRIHGGSGVSPSREGSIGVCLDSSPGTPHIHDNVIHGGSGTGAVGSLLGVGSTGIAVYGAALTATNGAAIERNLIVGGSGVDTNGVPASFGSVGIFLSNSVSTAADIVDNVLEAGSGQSPNVGTVAVLDQALGNVLLSRNTVDVGSPSSGRAAGFFLDGNGGLHSMTNNVLRQVATSGSVPRGAWLGHVGSVIFSHNTVLVDNTGTGLFVDGVNTGLTVAVNDNLFLGLGIGNALDDANSTSAVTSLKGNGFIGAFNALAKVGTSKYLTPADLAVFGAASSNNFITAASCTSGADCVRRPACVSPTTCIQDVVVFSGAPDNGFAAVNSHAGWPLAYGTPCLLFTRGFDDRSVCPVDFAGRSRSATPTVGAFEAGCCGY